MLPNGVDIHYLRSCMCLIQNAKGNYCKCYRLYSYRKSSQVQPGPRVPGPWISGPWIPGRELTWLIGEKACFDIIMILYCIFNEKERLEIIWKTRVNAFGLWSILICFVVAVMELILGLSARAYRTNTTLVSGE